MNRDVSLSFPHVFQATSVRSMYLKLSIALTPLLLFGMVRGGSPTIMVFVVAVATGAMTEFLIDLVHTADGGPSTSRNGRVLYLMLLISVLVPPSTPPLVVAAAAAASILFGVHLVGGVGVYYVHPVFVGLLVVAGSGITTVPTTEPSLIASLAGVVADSGVYRFVLDSFFAPLGMRVPPEALALLINVGDIGAVSIGAALIPVLIVSSLIVFGEDLIPGVLAVTFLIGAVLVLHIGDVDIMDFLVRSNLLLILIFGLADPETRPLRPLGMAIFGLSAGVLSALLLVTSGAVFPVVTGVVFVATLRPLIDQLVRKG